MRKTVARAIHTQNFDRGRPVRPRTTKKLLPKALTMDCCRLRQVLPFVHRLRYGEEDIEALFVNDTLVHITRVPLHVPPTLVPGLRDEGSIGTAAKNRGPVHAYVGPGGVERMDEAMVAAARAAVRSLAEAKTKALEKAVNGTK